VVELPRLRAGEPDPLLSCNVWYQTLGADSGQRQQRWREFPPGSCSSAATSLWVKATDRISKKSPEVETTFNVSEP
jgi:hypothetical protein